VIVTLTPNPSIDRTVTLAGELERGAVLRAESVTSQGGGKGVNISRAAVAAGVPTIAVLPGLKDSPFVLDLFRDGIDCRPEAPAGDVRVNLTLTEPDGTTTKVNTPGAAVRRPDLDRLAAAVTHRARRAQWVVLAGSLPPGAPDAWYGDLLAQLSGTGASVAVDTSGAPLVALAAGLEDHAPSLMKPNGEELASLTGGDADLIEADPLAAATAAGELVARGVGAVLATLGGSGAVLVTPEGAWHATPPPRRRGQHRGSRRLQPVRLPPRRPPRRGRSRAAPPRGRLRQRRSLPAGDHDPHARPPATGPRRGAGAGAPRTAACRPHRPARTSHRELRTR
jgi:1-phosphofructokinase